MKSDPGFLKLRKIRAAQTIARVVSESNNNKVFSHFVYTLSYTYLMKLHWAYLTTSYTTIGLPARWRPNVEHR